MLAAEHLPDRYNAAEWFVGRHAKEGRGERVALLTDTASLTYAQLDDAVRRFAAVLIRAGVHAGDRVALILSDTPLLSIGFWGAIAAGAVAVPMNTLLKSEDHRKIVADCDARLLIADPAIVDGSRIAGSSQTSVWTPDEANRLLADARPAEGYAPTHRDGFAFILYSSGTTGEPKGVVHLQHDMWVCCETYGKTVLHIEPSDRCFSVAKLFFAYGLGNAQYFPFHVGASAVLFGGRPTPESVFEQVRRHRPTLFFGVPTAYANMLASMEGGTPADFSSVRLCASAGEALPGSLFERWLSRTRLEILDGIGSTEICHIFLSNQTRACRAGSSGVPVLGYELRIVDDKGLDAPRGELGDLLVRGDSTMAFYWNKHEATKRTLQGEWIRTGDKYRQDADGYFFHGGRTDDMLKVGGIWVSPVEVEGVLVSNPKVLECAVVGENDANGLVKPSAFVTLRPGVEAGGVEAELKAFAKQKLAPFKCPHRFSIVAELPKTATGKIQRFLLRGRTS
jgi:benzoate-CoA ligase family protein